MKRSIVLFSSFIIIACLGFLSFTIQYKFNDLEKNVLNIEREIKNIDVEIKVLQTELSHLTSISKIKSLSNKYIKNFHQISKYDFIDIFDIPINPLFE